MWASSCSRTTCWKGCSRNDSVHQNCSKTTFIKLILKWLKMLTVAFWRSVAWEHQRLFLDSRVLHRAVSVLVPPRPLRLLQLHSKVRDWATTVFSLWIVLAPLDSWNFHVTFRTSFSFFFFFFEVLRFELRADTLPRKPLCASPKTTKTTQLGFLQWMLCWWIGEVEQPRTWDVFLFI
jgi:hypothetical protein